MKLFYILFSNHNLGSSMPSNIVAIFIYFWIVFDNIMVLECRPAPRSTTIMDHGYLR